ncbi:MAG: hypothetical protein GTN36_03800 [Candidatus Aenigmarchaeota archaeon]|nr:hypothetical protein [Candidatus Aenigmarchaeota archaeon]
MIKNVSNDKAFWFCTSSGFTGKIAHNLSEFSECLKTVPVESLEFHLRDNKNDFEAWLKGTMDEPKFAASMKRIKKKNIRGDALRDSINRLSKKIAKSA